jgi:ketosteroid isomerase-like protein
MRPDRWTIEPLVRPRRGFDERLMLVAPAATRRLRAGLSKAPVGSKRRRAALTRAVRTGYAATNRDDYAVMRASVHPEGEFYPPSHGDAALGFDPVYRGPEGFVAFVQQWKSGFSAFTYEPREIADAGERFAVRLGMVGLLRGSDAEVREEYGTVITLKGGQVFRQENFRDWDAALDALARV